MAKKPTKPAKPAKKSPVRPAKQKPRPAAKPKARPAPAKAKSVKPKPIKRLPVKSAPGKTDKDKVKSSMEKPSKKSALRNSILKRKVSAKPIAFSLDEVRAIAKTATAKAESTAKDAKATAKPSAAKQALALEKAKPTHVKAASLADILGFNPKKAKSIEALVEADVPDKFKRYYKLLIDLRTHLTAGIELHSEETLKRSSKDDAGDLSSYGQHMADAGTDTFDRDFALSLVSSEQEALGEIDAAIKRIKDGSYGLCEINQTPIAKDRLLAVPFTRYSAEAQKGLERNRHRARAQAGILGELGEDGGGSTRDDSGGGDE